MDNNQQIIALMNDTINAYKRRDLTIELFDLIYKNVLELQKKIDTLNDKVELLLKTEK
jgi:hypothetical protein